MSLLQATAEDIESPSEQERISEANEMLDDLQTQFRKYAREKGYWIDATKRIPVVHTPKGAFEVYRRSLSFKVPLQLTFKESTCREIHKPVECSTELDTFGEDFQFLKPGAKPFLSDDSLNETSYLETNFSTASRQFPHRYVKTPPRFNCPNFDFLPKSHRVLVSSWMNDGRFLNVQTRQNSQITGTGLPGFLGKIDTAKRSLEIHFFNESTEEEEFRYNRKYYLEFNPEFPNFQWNVVDENSGAACLLQGSNTSQEIDVDKILKTFKLLRTEPLVNLKNSGAASFEFKSIRQYLIHCAAHESANGSLRAKEFDEPVLNFVQIIGKLNSFGTGTGSSGEFLWQSKKHPHCTVSLGVRWDGI